MSNPNSESTRQKDTENVTLMVVEDDPAMLVAFRDVLEGAGYKVITAHNGQAALEKLEDARPDMILSDISMPIMDGYQLFEAVRKLPGGSLIPFIFLTARGTREDIFAGKSLGADDYITKPVTTHELISAVRARLKRSGEQMLAQLKSAYRDSLFALANAIEARDAYTHAHMHRLSAYARAIATELGWTDEELEVLEFGAILHDIGKIYIPEAVLLKNGSLSEDEQAHMQRHPEVGARMIRDIPYLAAAVPMVLYHHERWDGRGYPEGLSGEEIPLGARVLAIADAFDAMTSNRPYRKALSGEQAFKEILRGSGKQFDPQVVEALQRCWETGKIQDILRSNHQPPEQGQN